MPVSRGVPWLVVAALDGHGRASLSLIHVFAPSRSRADLSIDDAADAVLRGRGDHHFHDSASAVSAELPMRGRKLRSGSDIHDAVVGSPGHDKGGLLAAALKHGSGRAPSPTPSRA